MTQTSTPASGQHIEPSAFIDATAILRGAVRIGARASVWPLAVLRGDGDAITIGAETNVQDGVVVHTDPGFPVVLGDRVTIGHRAVIHGARVEDDCLIGVGAIVLNGARVGRGSLVGAGAVVPEGMEIPAGSVVLGVPARVVRPVREDLERRIRHSAESYVRRAQESLAGGGR